MSTEQNIMHVDDDTHEQNTLLTNDTLQLFLSNILPGIIWGKLLLISGYCKTWKGPAVTLEVCLSLTLQTTAFQDMLSFCTCLFAGS